MAGHITISLDPPAFCMLGKASPAELGRGRRRRVRELIGGGTLLGLMMFSDNVASAIRETRPTPLANFKEGEGDPYIHSTASGRAVGQVGS